jgi:hypothetical protein
MRRILTEVPDGPVKNLNHIAAKMGFRLEFPGRLLDAIVDRALASGLGARAMHTHAARAAERAMHEVPDLIRRQGRRAIPGYVVVQLRSDSLDNGYFAVRFTMPEGGVEMEVPAGATGRRAAARGG